MLLLGVNLFERLFTDSGVPYYIVGYEGGVGGDVRLLETVGVMHLNRLVLLRFVANQNISALKRVLVGLLEYPWRGCTLRQVRKLIISYAHPLEALSHRRATILLVS